MKKLLLIFGPLTEIFIKDKSSFRFAVGIIIGLAFSICIILSTIGIMDGFDFTFKRALKKSVGDIYIYSSGREGFYQVDDKMKENFKRLGITDYSPLVQSESFLIANEETKGVIIRGIDPLTFKAVTTLSFPLANSDVAIGSELASQLKIKINDEVVLTFVSGENEMNGLPVLKRFRVGAIVKHGIYQKDLRLVYMERSKLQALLGMGNRVNIISLNIPSQKEAYEQINEISLFQQKLKTLFGFSFSVKPFWNEYSSLIEAVQIEKKAISLTLQTIVVIAIFNVLAFVIFLNERHSRSLFLFKAMGLSQKGLVKIWFMLVSVIWFFSCLLSILFIQAVDWALGHFSFLQLPSDIYYIGRLNLLIDQKNYILVFFITLLWLFLISWIGLRRMKKQPILQGLRKEFA